MRLPSEVFQIVLKKVLHIPAAQLGPKHLKTISFGLRLAVKARLFDAALHSPFFSEPRSVCLVIVLMKNKLQSHYGQTRWDGVFEQDVEV